MRTADTTRHDRKTCTRCGDELDLILDVCHNCAGRLAFWLATSTHKSRWRERANAAMRAVVNANRELAATDPAALLKLVDAAYPFGERAMHPYKAWLAERKIFVDVLFPPKPPAQPTQDDYAACLVALDLVEIGRVDDTKKLLDEQAPNRLGRKCPACGAKPLRQCFDLATTNAADLGYSVIPERKSVERLVPHDARVEPKQPAPLPLFERSRT